MMQGGRRQRGGRWHPGDADEGRFLDLSEEEGSSLARLLRPEPGFASTPSHKTLWHLLEERYYLQQHQS